MFDYAFFKNEKFEFHDLHLLELVKLIFHSTKLSFMCEHAHVQCVCLRHRTDQRP